MRAWTVAVLLAISPLDVFGAPVTEDVTLEPDFLQIDVAFGSVLAAEGSQVAAVAPRYYGDHSPPSLIQGEGRAVLYEWDGVSFSQLSLLDGYYNCQQFGYKLDLAVYPGGETLLGAQQKGDCSALFNVSPYASGHRRELDGNWSWNLANEFYSLDSVSVTTSGETPTMVVGRTDATVATGSVVSIDMGWEGQGYTWADDVGQPVTIAPPSTPGGETATAVIGRVSMGQVSRVDVTFGGSGYTSNPSVTIPPPVGNGNPGNASASRDAEVGSVKFVDVTGGIADQTVKPDDGADGDRFGLRVAIDGDQAAIAAGSGKVYLVVRGVSGWEITQTLSPAAAGTTGFGSRLALSGHHLVVAAASTDVDGLTDAGRVFYFNLGADPIVEVVLSPAVPVAREQFGGAVGVNEDGVVLVGAPGPSYQEILVGRAFAFEIDAAGVATELAEMVPSDGDLGDHFGASIAIVDNQVLVGSPDHNEGRGAVYVYGLELAACPAVEGSPTGDLDADGVCDGEDACPSDAENDVDGDGICADVDNCPTDLNAGQGDMDGDGVGNICDVCISDAADDSDGDGSCDAVDLCTGDDATGDHDADGFCGDVDADDDGDGLLDVYETNSGSFEDVQNTGTNPLSADTDGDGFDDGIEVGAGTDPNDETSMPAEGVGVPAFGTAARILLLLSFAGFGGIRLRRSWRRLGP